MFTLICHSWSTGSVRRRRISFPSQNDPSLSPKPSLYSAQPRVKLTAPLTRLWKTCTQKLHSGELQKVEYRDFTKSDNQSYLEFGRIARPVRTSNTCPNLGPALSFQYLLGLVLLRVKTLKKSTPGCQLWGSKNPR